MRAADTPDGRWSLFQAGLLALLIAFGVLRTLGLHPWAWLVAAVFLTIIGASLSRLGTVAKALLTVLLVTGLVAGLDDKALFLNATHSAVFLTSLIAALLLLGRIVGRAPDICQCAEMLVSQPQGRRYLALTLGAHLLSIILNFGAVALLSAFLAPQRDTLQRQGAEISLTLAVLRGFAAMPMWSPLALSVLITLSLIPEVSYWRILPVCLCAATLYMLAGIALNFGSSVDRDFSSPEPLYTAASGQTRPVLLRVLARTLGLVGGVVVLHLASGLPMLSSVFIMILGAVGWSWAREAIEGSGPARMIRDLGAISRDGVNELVILATAAFVGTVLAHYMHGMVDASPLAGRLEISAAIALVPAVMVACGMLAINPILSGTILIGALKPVWPGDDLHMLALSVIIGWGITSAGTPFTANVLIAARNMNIRASILAFDGNGRLTVLALALYGSCGAVTSYLW